MGKVFLAESAGNFDLSGAQPFGKIVWISDRLSPFRVKNTVQVLTQGLKDLNFNPEEDYICLTGRSVVIAMFLAIAARHYGLIKILVYDARNGSYEQRMFSANSNEIEENQQWKQIPNGSSNSMKS